VYQQYFSSQKISFKTKVVIFNEEKSMGVVSFWYSARQTS